MNDMFRYMPGTLMKTVGRIKKAFDKYADFCSMPYSQRRFNLEKAVGEIKN